MALATGLGVLIIASFMFAVTEGASFYGESYIRVPFQQASRDTDIQLQFKTHLPHGLLLMASGTTDFFIMELKSGVIQVRVNLGSGEVKLHSTPGLRLDDLQWHSVHVNQSLGTFNLNVDNVMIRSIDTTGSFHELNVEHGIFLGGTGTFNDVFHGNFKNFRGCQKDVFFNQYNILHSAKQMKDPLYTFEIFWECDDEFDAGSDQPISFKSDTSFIAFPHFRVRSKGTFSCDLITRSGTAVVFFNSGRHEAVHDFIALEIIDGHLKLSINKGNGVETLTSSLLVNDGRWHQIDISLSITSVELKVDDEVKSLHFKLGDNVYLNLDGHLFVGGLNVHARSRAIKRGLSSLQGDTATKPSLYGCVRNVIMNKRVYGFREARISRLVDPRCKQFPCSSDPCIDGSKCSETTDDKFTCECDREVCIKGNFTSGDGQNNPSDVVMIKDLHVEEGAQMAITTDIINIVFNYKGYRIRESAIMFQVEVPPQYGKIDIDVRRRKESNRFTLLDLIGDKISYIHDGTETISDDVTFQMTINSHGSDLPNKYQGPFSFIVPITIRPHNDAPTLLTSAGTSITIARGTRMKITKELLSVGDPDTKSSMLVFTVVYRRSENGFFVKGNNDLKISSFTQADINSGLIWFLDSSGDTASRFQISVDDGLSKSNPIDMQMSPVDLKLDVFHNTGLNVFHGTAANIRSDNLTTTTNVPSQQLDIRYKVTQLPKYGQIQRRKHENDAWISVDSFSQRHIDKDRLRYVQTKFSNNPPSDVFAFTVTVKESSVDKTKFEIHFLPVSLKISQNSKLLLKHVTYSPVTNKTLLVEASTDAVDSDKILFNILRLPSHGSIYHTNTDVTASADFSNLHPLRVNSNFTQDDIDHNNIYYKVTHPSFNDLEDFIDLKVSFVGSQSVTSRLVVNFVPEHTSVRFVNNGLSDVIEGGMKVIEKDHLFLEVDNIREAQFAVMSGPEHGSLMLTDPRTSSVVEDDVIGFTNKDIREGRLVYKHDDSENQLDAFIFTVTPYTGSSSDTTEIEEYTGTFSISVIMRNDNPPAVLSNNIFHVVKNKDKLLTIDDLEFEDPDVDYDSNLLKYSRRGIPNGKIVSAQTGDDVFEFTQLDLREKNLVFKHKGSDHDRAAMWVTDGQFVKPFLFVIQASDPYVKIVKNTGISVRLGGHVPLTSQNLSIETNVNVESSLVNFVMTEEPLNGHLRVRGKHVTEFTLEDIQDGRIRYWHDSSHVMEDKFKFAVIVDGSQVNGIFPIVVFHESDLQPPQVAHNKFLEIPEGSQAVISSDHLQVTHSDTPPKDIVFTVSLLPAGGLLGLQSKAFEGGITPTFTQQDIDKGFLTFRQTSSDVINDKFVFDVTNGHKSLLNLQFFIEIIPLSLPLVVRNISVVESERVQITNKLLFLKGRYFKNEEVTYKITTYPSHGWFDLSESPGVRVTSFSSDDVSQQKVFFEHNGDENIEDQFSIIAMQNAGGKRSQDHVGFIFVKPVNDRPPRTVVNAGLDVWKGSTTAVTNHSLLALDEDSSPSEVVFKVSSPTVGHLALITNTFKAVSSFSQEQINRGDIVYVHEGDGDGEFNFMASDGINNDILRVFKIQAKPLVLKLNVEQDLEVFPNTLQPILPDNLLSVTSDPDHSKAIVYTLESSPRKGKIVTLMEGQPLEITSFTQTEVTDGSVYYLHEGYIPKWSETDTIVFKVSTAYAKPLDDGILQVKLSYGNVNAGNINTLMRITPVSVDEGEAVVILREHLDVSDLLYRLQQFERGISVEYILKHLPQSGQLTRRGLRIQQEDSFTQDDINNGVVKYAHDDSDTESDVLQFALRIRHSRRTEETFNGNLTFRIKPVNDEKFTLITRNPSLRVIQGGTANITDVELKTTDPDTIPSEIIYTVVNGPANGMLVFSDFPEINLNRFTQQDINDYRLQYIHDGSSNGGEFYFNVFDGKFTPYYKMFKFYVIPLTVEVTEKPIELVQSQTSVHIKVDSINITTNADRESVWYNITNGPHYGQIYIQDISVNSFSQMDIDNEMLLYIQTNMSSGSDGFTCNVFVKDVNDRISTETFEIIVKPLVKQRSLQAPVHTSAAITRYTLDASELAEITRGNPTYTISKPPTYGKILKLKRGRRSVDKGSAFEEIDSFSHEDIVYTKIYYKANPVTLTGAVEDSFEYVLQAQGVQPAEGRLIVSVQPSGHSTTISPIVPRSSTLEFEHGDAATRQALDGDASVPPVTRADEINSDKVSSDSPIETSYIIIICVVILAILIILVVIIGVVLFRRRRRQDVVQEDVKTKPKPRPFISSPLQVDQPHVHIQPQMDDPDSGLSESPVVPAITLTQEIEPLLSEDRMSSSAPRSPDLTRQEVSRTVPTCTVTPLLEVLDNADDDAAVHPPESARSTQSTDAFNFDWSLMDPDLLQHCRTTTPVLRNNQYWV